MENILEKLEVENRTAAALMIAKATSVFIIFISRSFYLATKRILGPWLERCAVGNDEGKDLAVERNPIATDKAPKHQRLRTNGYLSRLSDTSATGRATS